MFEEGIRHGTHVIVLSFRSATRCGYTPYVVWMGPWWIVGFEAVIEEKRPLPLFSIPKTLREQQFKSYTVPNTYQNAQVRQHWKVNWYHYITAGLSTLRRLRFIWFLHAGDSMRWDTKRAEICEREKLNQSLAGAGWNIDPRVSQTILRRLQQSLLEISFFEKLNKDALLLEIM